MARVNPRSPIGASDASGNGMDIAVIDGDGFRRLSDGDVEKRHKALKLPMSYHA